MSNLEKVKKKEQKEQKEKKEQKEILKIDYSDEMQIRKYSMDKYKDRFDWKQYVSYYIDLKHNTNMNNLNEAWRHWIKFGIREKRLFFLVNDNETLNKVTYFTSNNEERKTKNVTNKNTINNNVIENKNNEKSVLKSRMKSIIKNTEPTTGRNPERTTDRTSEENMERNTYENTVRNIDSVVYNVDNLDKKNKITKDITTNKYYSLSQNIPPIQEVEIEKNNKNTIHKKIAFQNITEKQKHLNIHYETVVDEITLKINLLRKNNIIYKNVYDGYGLHYYGWKKIMTNFIEALNNTDDNTIITFKEQFLFDEWLEKFLIWGDKNEKNYLIQEIEKNSYKLISFIHNSPFTSWYNDNYQINIRNEIIFNDEYTNNYLFKELIRCNLHKKIAYLYTLSNSHKEYIYNNNKNMKNKIISILHPIEITGQEKTFDYTLFTQNKQILHIGWVLRNFKSFIQFKQPSDFYKTMLIKKDFENEWNKLSNNYALNNITILKQLNNSDYEKLFVNSCVFLDLEDSTSNNTLLECIKFNTPVIVRKLPSVIEYLGKDYPLYFETDEDLLMLKNPNYFLKKIMTANTYLSKMDKTHISIEYFNKKLLYDIKKLDIYEDSILTWFCLIDNLDNIDKNIHNLYNNFISQNDNKKIKLKIIVNDNLQSKDSFNDFILKIEKTCEIMNNIDFLIKNLDNYCDFLNFCFETNETKYFMVVDILDDYSSSFSNICKMYLDNTPTCDITFSSFTILNNTYEEKFVYEKDFMLFNKNLNQTILPERGVVFRKDVNKLLGYFNNYNDISLIFREYISRAIKNNLNVMCCESNLINTIKKK